MLANATQWVNGDGDERDRCFIEAVCNFLKITPVTERLAVVGSFGAATLRRDIAG